MPQKQACSCFNFFISKQHIARANWRHVFCLQHGLPTHCDLRNDSWSSVISTFPQNDWKWTIDEREIDTHTHTHTHGHDKITQNRYAIKHHYQSTLPGSWPVVKNWKWNRIPPTPPIHPCIDHSMGRLGKWCQIVLCRSKKQHVAHNSQIHDSIVIPAGLVLDCNLFLSFGNTAPIGPPLDSLDSSTLLARVWLNHTTLRIRSIVAQHCVKYRVCDRWNVWP